MNSKGDFYPENNVRLITEIATNFHILGSVDCPLGATTCRMERVIGVAVHLLIAADVNPAGRSAFSKRR